MTSHHLSLVLFSARETMLCQCTLFERSEIVERSNVSTLLTLVVTHLSRVFFCYAPGERVLEPIMALNSKKQNKSSGVIVLLKGIDSITPSWAQYSLAAL